MRPDWKKEVFTIPNILSLVRLAMIPVYMVIYLRATKPEEFFAAGAILAASCLTDLIDGWIARKYNMISTLGKVLDPIADKATQLTLTFSLSLKYPVLKRVLMLLTFKEAFQLVAGILALRKGKMLSGAMLTGKICTTVLFVSLIALVLFPQMPAHAIDTISLVDALFLALSFAGYILAYSGKTDMIQDIKPNEA